MSDNGSESGAKVAISIALFILAVFSAIWINEHFNNPEERHTQKLEDGRIYVLESDDPCRSVEPAELYIKSISQDMDLMIASIRLQIEDESSVRDTVYTYALYHAATTLPLQVYYCGQRRTVGYIWSAYEGIFGLPGFVKLRMEKGFIWKAKATLYK